MAKNKTSAKKTIRKQIEQQLFATFDHLKERSDPKKLKRSIRRASKILSASVRAEPAKKKLKDKKTAVDNPKDTITAEANTN